MSKLGTVVIATTLAFGSCKTADAPSVRDTSSLIARAKSLDRPPTLVNADTAATPGEGVAYPVRWTPTVRFTDSLFTIAVPASALVERKTPAGVARAVGDVAISHLPECKWACNVSVSMWRDSTGQGLPGIIRTLTAHDTTQGALDPNGEGSVIDSLPLGEIPAVHFQMSCGDCMNRVIFSAHLGWIASIAYYEDDREGYSPALKAKLEALARSFRWRP